ncbi:hypothetical protein BDQ17DRAFT_1436117 [Cyathus striatus]|nr:hypothetical protein BDQ17DRAFT_1436117 [Cyathus striatus]
MVAGAILPLHHSQHIHWVGNIPQQPISPINAPLPAAAPQNDFGPQNISPINTPVPPAHHYLPADLGRGRRRGRGGGQGGGDGETNTPGPIHWNDPVIAEDIPHHNNQPPNLQWNTNVPPPPPLPVIPPQNVLCINTPPPAVQNVQWDHPIIAANIQQPVIPPPIAIPQVILPPLPPPVPISNVQQDDGGIQWMPHVLHPNLLPIPPDVVLNTPTPAPIHIPPFPVNIQNAPSTATLPLIQNNQDLHTPIHKTHPPVQNNQEHHTPVHVPPIHLSNQNAPEMQWHPPVIAPPYPNPLPMNASVIAPTPQNIQWNAPVLAPAPTFRVNQENPLDIHMNAPAPIPIPISPFHLNIQNTFIAPSPPIQNNNPENHINIQWNAPAPAPAPLYHIYPEIHAPPAPPVPPAPPAPSQSQQFQFIEQNLAPPVFVEPVIAHPNPMVAVLAPPLQFNLQNMMVIDVLDIPPTPTPSPPPTPPRHIPIACQPFDHNWPKFTLGPFTDVCPDCDALHWKAEHLTTSTREHLQFGSCCLTGKVKLPGWGQLPRELMELLAKDGSKNFQNNIC